MRSGNKLFAGSLKFKPIIDEPILEIRPNGGMMYATKEWHWEGNVAKTVADYLKGHGWEILEMADTLSRQRGIDVHAARAGKNLLVEVKGYPSKHYRDPRRAGERKRTSPTGQAGHWYSHGLLEALRLQWKHPGAMVALAFPDFPRYRLLYNETRTGLEKLGLGLLFIREDGDISTFGLRDYSISTAVRRMPSIRAM